MKLLKFYLFFKQYLIFNSWFNGIEMENYQIEGSTNKKFIKIESLTKEKIGLYKIVATNQIGSDEASWNVAIDSKSFSL